MILQLLTIATGLLVAGFYLSFTLVIFPALTRTEAHRARTFMVYVNTYAQRPPFLSLFFLGLLSSAGSLIACLARGDFVGSAGSALVLAGAILTIAVNVPFNRQLERNLLPWRSYEARWIKANTARALGSALGAVLVMTAG